jgi:hypothetical protein
MNYAQLVAALEAYPENLDSSFVANIPNFVKIAEQRVYNEVELPVFRKNVTGTLTASNKYLTLPSDWLATNSLAITTTGYEGYLINKDVEFIREAYPVPTATGTPQYYAQFDVNTLILGPTPDLAYAVELHYFYYPQSIVTDPVTANTTWLGDNYDSVLLYGALREAAVFMQQEADIVAMYESKYKESLGLLVTLAKGKLRRDTYRNTQIRMPVQ